MQLICRIDLNWSATPSPARSFYIVGKFRGFLRMWDETADSVVGAADGAVLLQRGAWRRAASSWRAGWWRRCWARARTESECSFTLCRGCRAAGGRRPAERARGAAAGDGTEVLFDNTTTQLASRCLPRITIDCGASPLLQKLPSCRSPVTFHKEHAYYYVIMLNALLFRLSLTKN